MHHFSVDEHSRGVGLCAIFLISVNKKSESDIPAWRRELPQLQWATLDTTQELAKSVDTQSRQELGCAVVRMILPRTTPGRAVPPPHLFETGPLQLTADPCRAVFSLPTLLL